MCELISAATMASVLGEGAAALTAMDAISVLGAGIGAMSAVQQGQAASANAAYQAQVHANNQIIAERQATDALKRGDMEATRHRQAVEGLKGRQRTALASANLDLSSGSPLDILADTAGLGELDALTIESNAAREAAGYRAQGMNFGAEAALERSRAKSSLASSGLAAGASLLTGVGTVADRWYRRRY